MLVWIMCYFLFSSQIYKGSAQAPLLNYLGDCLCLKVVQLLLKYVFHHLIPLCVTGWESLSSFSTPCQLLQDWDWFMSLGLMQKWCVSHVSLRPLRRLFCFSDLLTCWKLPSALSPPTYHHTVNKRQFTGIHLDVSASYICESIC